MDESVVKQALTVMIETKTEIQLLLAQIDEIETKLNVEDRPLTVAEVNEKMENLASNEAIYSELKKKLSKKNSERKNAEKLILDEVPIADQNIVVDLGDPHGKIQLKKVEDIYKEQGPKIEYGHVFDLD